jgi:Type II secretory pathway, prepilin signal peptidase PulO and related peptidases
MTYYLIIYTIVFLYGIVIGSFLNVCILRIPAGESIVTGRSHCDNCKTKIKWYDLIPVLSYFLLRGKCRNCKAKISIQYPMIEALNGILYVLVFYCKGVCILSAVYCLAISALLVLSMIDLRTHTIPFGINLFIFFLGVIRLLLDYQHFSVYLIGFFAVSGFLYLIYLVTRGKGMGGGDIKLMAAVGLLLGWKLIMLAFFLGCILASIIHPIRMKVKKQGKVLAFGPYLSAGIIIAVLYGDKLIEWYLNTFVRI